MPYKDLNKRREVRRSADRKRRKRLRTSTAELSAGHEGELFPAPVAAAEIPPDYPADPAAALESWAADRLVVPPGHPQAGRPMELPAYAVAFLRDGLAAGIREAALLIARKNAKSALAAVLLLGHLAADGPLRRRGWRCGVASLSKEKSAELWLQAEGIAEASGLSGIRFGKAPRCMVSAWGRVDFLSADKAAGHASGFDLALVDELGLFDERGRALVSGMLSSTSARDGRMIAISVRGDSPMTAELVERRGDPAVAVHLYAAADGAALDDEAAWHEANPGLAVGIKSLGYMRDMARKAAALPSERANFATFDLNRPTSPTQHLLAAPEQLAACERDAGELPPRTASCWLGLDLGSTLSMSAAAAVFDEVNGVSRVELLCMWGDQPELADRAKLDGVGPLYQLAADAGELLLAEGAAVDPADFLAAVVAWLDGARVQCVAFDTYKAGNVRAELNKNALAWPVYQTARTATGAAHRSADIDRFRLALQQRTVAFPRPNLLLTNAVARSHVHVHPNGQGELRKARDTARIDPLAAALLAVGARDSRPRARSWEGEGEIWGQG